MNLNRCITVEECPWLPYNLNEGHEVFPFHGATYGCISPNGVAITLNAQGDNPFFEIPRDSVEGE